MTALQIFGLTMLACVAYLGVAAWLAGKGKKSGEVMLIAVVAVIAVVVVVASLLLTLGVIT